VGDFDYERGGATYSSQRRADPTIAGLVLDALGDARTVVNVGAGAGSYEPTDRYVLAVEPSPMMRSQRPRHLAPALDATAEALPFDDDSFDAAMATVTIHQWGDAATGLRELRRVARGPVVALTFDGDALERFWLADYVPELIAAERRRYQPLDWICEQLGGECSVRPVPIPIDCTDGFTEAFYARPERFLEDDVRRAQSAWGFVDDVVEARAVARLRDDLANGEWHGRYGSLLDQPTFDGSLRLIVATPKST
jgi:SAM-dependent methyltransferase